MKIKTILCLIIMVTMSFTSCKTEGDKEEKKTEEVAKTEYQCPMKCEKDKTYTDSHAKCPVCNMDLVEVKHEIEENHEH